MGDKHEVTYRFGEFELNSAERTLLRNGERVPLTPRAFDLLVALIVADGHLVSKEKLLESVWADAIVEEGNLNRTISALRKALGETKRENRYIETVPKAGYRFVGRVEALKGDRLTNGASQLSEPIKSRMKSRPAGYLMFCGVFLLLFGSLVAVYLLVPESTPAKKNKDVRDLVRLTENQFDEDQAEWTEDNQIRFIRFVTATRAESWVMNADGTNQRRANERIKDLRTGNWSPNGKKVVFTKDGEPISNVYLANSDGSNEVKLPFNYPPNDWSPDGTKLVYGSLVDKSNSDIFVFEIETSKRVNITNSKTFEADPLFSPDGKQVTFTSSRDGNNESYVMNLEGSNVRRLTNHPAVDAFPSITTDGTQFVFDAKRESENVDIYLQNFNDDNPPIKLTNLPSNEEHRGNCFSPDGTKMVITSDQSGKNQIYVLNLEPFKPKLFLADSDSDLQFPTFSDGGKKLVYQAKLDEKNIEIRNFDQTGGAAHTIFTERNASPNVSFSPAISPDGTKIAFANKIDGNTDIFLMNSDGSDVKNLSNNSALDASPTFSPDGKEIFFQSNREGNFQRTHLFRMNLDGTNQRRITDKEGYEFSPSLSPDGKTLLFAGDREDGKSHALDIFLLNLENTSEEKILAVRRLHDAFPTFSPDGKRVAFVSQSDGNAEIYLMNTDGSGLVRLTRNAAEDTTPQFSGDGKSIYFSSDREGKFALYEISLTSNV